VSVGKKFLKFEVGEKGKVVRTKAGKDVLVATKISMHKKSEIGFESTTTF